jgi:cellobiose phosphorylase
MRYGFFDEQAREYVVERPDTPRPWTNYIGSRAYGGVISNHAGGYSFLNSPAEGRLLRFRYNGIPADQPGRIFYLRDRENADFWSAAWQPVGKPLENYASECRFGTGYATISSDYAGIRTRTSYFVPLGEKFEVWWLQVENTSDRARKIDVFPFAEFTSEWNLINDLLNLQYSQYIVEAGFRDGMIHVASCSRLPEDLDNFSNRDQSRHWWMAVTGANVSGWDCDREAFIGNYGSFAAPAAVVDGRCRKSSAYADNACGAFQVPLELAPGESRDIVVLLGAGRGDREGVAAREGFASPLRLGQEFEKIKAHWHGLLDTFQVETPDADFNSTVNTWGHYNALMTLEWARCCSFVYTGDQRDGLGFRDSLQDCLGVTVSQTHLVRERLELMLTGQDSTGGAQPEIRPWLHQPGKMRPTPPEHYRSDDCLWFFNAIPAYVNESGDVGFYRKVLPYADEGESTVLGHLRRALEFNLERTGRNGLPCGLLADWNDCLKLGYHGESVFVAFQLRLGLDQYSNIASLLGESQEAAWAKEQLSEMDARIREKCWDGDWFIWAIAEDGTVFGSKQSPEGQIYLNTQAWAVLSGFAQGDQRDACLDAVRKRLFTPFGVMICDPAFQQTPVAVMRAVLMQPGCKENGGIFSHTQSWAVLAEVARGNGDAAMEYYRAFMPSAQNEKAEIREIEPYVHCQSTHSRQSQKEGRSRVPWLSGTASWANYAAQTGILGIQAELDGLRIDPCIPRSWKGFTVRRRFRGNTYEIKIQNPSGLSKGVRELLVNGSPVAGNLIPFQKTDAGTVVRIEATLEQ